MHKVNGNNPDRPEIFMLCLQEGCHKYPYPQKEERHILIKYGECLYCHDEHGNHKVTLCYACHPLVKGSGKNEIGGDGLLHTRYFFLLNKVFKGREFSCVFCHSKFHNGECKNLKKNDCFICHWGLNTILSKRKETSLNVHFSFKEKKCVTCHDVHKERFHPLLKKEKASYLEENIEDGNK